MNSDTANPTPTQLPYFHREDWHSFALATVLVFIGYWFSLADNVGLDFSGIYSAGASYVGVPHPPGYPLWTMYAWLFTKLLPFSNTAWRIAVSSAVAGALTCGVIALMVSRGSATLLEAIPSLRRLARRDEQRLRLVAGGIAGMTFGFDRAFWCNTVIVDVWPLSLLLLSLVLCLLMRWAHQPERRRYFHGACFIFGLTVTNSQALIPVGLGLLFLVALTDKDLGRDAAFIATLLLVACLVGHFLDLLPGGGLAVFETRFIFTLILLVTVGLWIGLARRTHRLRPARTILLGPSLFLAGTSFYLLVPMFSMTNPPVNWGYPRTLEGFSHVLSRGQYERLTPTSGFTVFATQMLFYLGRSMKDLGLFPILIAVIPFGFSFRMEGAQRRWLMVALLNPPLDRQAATLIAEYFTASHLVIAVLMGYGFVLLGTMLSRSSD